MANDELDHGLPFAHIIHSSGTAATLARAFDVVAGVLGPAVQPIALLMDDADPEINAAKACVWGKKGAEVSLCNWHVKRAWIKNLITKVSGKAN